MHLTNTENNSIILCTCGRGGIGRRARFRIWYRTMWRFKSFRPQNRKKSTFGCFFCFYGERSQTFEQIAPHTNAYVYLSAIWCTSRRRSERARFSSPARKTEKHHRLCNFSGETTNTTKEISLVVFFCWQRFYERLHSGADAALSALAVAKRVKESA